MDYIFTLGEEHEKNVTLVCCKKCLTSFYNRITFPVPTKYDTIRWSLIWENPTSIRLQDDLKDIVDTNVEHMDQPHFKALCSWSLHYVLTCRILITHAFHYPGVQCYLSQDRETWSTQDRDKQVEIDNQQ